MYTMQNPTEYKVFPVGVKALKWSASTGTCKDGQPDATFWKNSGFGIQTDVLRILYVREVSFSSFHISITSSSSNGTPSVSVACCSERKRWSISWTVSTLPLVRLLQCFASSFFVIDLLTASNERFLIPANTNWPRLAFRRRFMFSWSHSKMAPDCLDMNVP